MKKNFKNIILFLIMSLLLTIVAGCGKKVSENASAGKAESDNITIKDSTGKEIKLNLPINKVISLNRQTSEALKIIGAGDKVIATGDTTVKNNPYLGFDNLPDLGETSKINIEEIIKLKPEIVFAHTNRIKDVLEEKLEPIGIKVIRIDNYLPEKMDEEMRLLGQIFNKKDRVEEYIKWKSDLEKLVADRVKAIPEKDKKKVMALSLGFLNSNGGFRVFPSKAKDNKPGVGEGYATMLAGGVDAAEDLEWNPAEASTTILVDKEYVLKKNPPVLTLHGTWLGGYNEQDINKFKEVIDNIMKKTDTPKLDAGKNKEMYIFHTDMLGANKRCLGILQLAKYLYPEQFKDIDTEKYAKEYFKKWLDTEYKGIWFYSVK